MPSSAQVTATLRKAVLQIIRDRGWGTTVAFLTCLMLLTQMLFVFLLSVRAVSHVLTNRAAIQLEVLPSGSEQDIQQLYATLKSHPDVRSVTFMSKEEVYEKQKALHPEDIAFLEQYDFANPFPSLFAVTLTSLDAYDRFAHDIQNDRWKSVVDPSFLASSSDHEQEIRTLLQVTGAVHTLSIVFMIVAFAVLACAVFEWTVRTAMRRGHELLLRHVMGAPPIAVLLPFTAEMSILLALGVVFSALCITGLLLLMPLLLPALVLETPFAALQAELMPMLWSFLPLFIVLQILCMPILAFAGAAMTARRHLPQSFTVFA